jgi:hypothetical protein
MKAAREMLRDGTLLDGLTPAEHERLREILARPLCNDDREQPVTLAKQSRQHATKVSKS